MPAAWPAISVVQYLDITVAPLDQRVTHPTDLGIPKTAALASTRQLSTSFDMILTGSELQTWMTWWEVDLALGAESFTGLEGVILDGDREYKFQQPPTWRMIRGGSAGSRLWRGTMLLWRVS